MHEIVCICLYAYTCLMYLNVLCIYMYILYRNDILYAARTLSNVCYFIFSTYMHGNLYNIIKYAYYTLQEY